MAIFIKDRRNWTHEFNSTNGMVGNYMDDVGQRGVHLAKWQVGYKSGALFRSLHHRTYMGVGDEVETEVGSSNPIALLHHEGSRPHEIRARRSSTLRYVQNNRIRYAKRVWHPGTRPNRYLTDNLRDML